MTMKKNNNVMEFYVYDLIMMLMGTLGWVLTKPLYLITKGMGKTLE